MIEKTAIDALKKICSIETGTWDNPVPFSKLYHEAKGIARETLAAIEAEKPVEDADEVAYDIEHECFYTFPDGGYNYKKQKAATIIQQHAESYHAEQCTACRKDRQPLPEDPRV